MYLHSSAFRENMPNDCNWHWNASPDTLRGGDSWHMKHCIIYTHIPLDPCHYHFRSASKMATPPWVWVANKSWRLSETRMRSQAETHSNSSPLKANTSLSLVVPQACHGWCQRCHHWKEKASSLGEYVIRILSESATRYSSTAYICANGNPAHWRGSLKCEMYVTAWAKGVRQNVSGQMLFLLFLSFYLFIPWGRRVSPKICFSVKWLFIKWCIMWVWTEVVFFFSQVNEASFDFLDEVLYTT